MLQNKVLINPNKVYYDPTVVRPFNSRSVKFGEGGLVCGGDWDSKLIPKDFIDTEETRFSHSLKAVLHGASWENTDYHRYILRKIKTRGRAFGCKSVQDIPKRLDHDLCLYNSILKDGVVHQKNNDDISIMVDRYGRCFFHDGGHRLAIARILNLTSIPAKVVCRHKLWVDSAKDVFRYAAKKKGLYASVNHFDFNQLKVYHPGRVDIIHKNSLFKKGSLVDIGSHWGYIPSMLEELGYKCTAVEGNTGHVKFMKMFRRANMQKFEIYEGALFKFHGAGKIVYDTMLALNIFHHFLKTEPLFIKLGEFLRRTSVKEMFFESSSGTERGLKGAFVDFTPDEFLQFVKDNAGLSNHNKLMTLDTGRVLFHIFK